MRMTFLRSNSFFMLSMLLVFQINSTALYAYDTPDPNLEVRVNDQVICIGDVVTVELDLSELTVDYTLTIDGNPVGASQAGTGGTLTFTSPPINGNTTIGVQATDVDATIDLQTYPIEVDTVLISGAATGVTALGNDGDIFICVEKGKAPFDISVSPANVTIRALEGNCLANYSITGLETGTYSVTITDAEGCSQSQTYEISGQVCSNFKVTEAAEEQPVSCFDAKDGAIKVTLQRFDDLNTITINPGNGVAPQTFTKAEIGDGSIFLTDLPAGEYNIVAVDDSGCQVAYMFNPVRVSGAANPVTVEYTLSDDTGAGDGSMQLCVNGGNRVYGIATIPDNGTITNSTDNSCDGNFSIEDLEAGDYSLLVQDGADCIDTIQFTINGPLCAFVIDSIKTDTVCAGLTGQIFVYTSGGTAPFDYDFGFGTFTQSLPAFAASLAGGNTVTFKVSDANGCTIDFGKPIALPLKSNIQADICVTNISDISNPLSGQADICITGGTAPYTVSLFGDDTTPIIEELPNPECANFYRIRNLTGGNQVVRIVDALGCSINQGFVVMAQTCPTFRVDSVNVNQVECFGANTGSLEIYTTGGVAPYEYFVSDYLSSTSEMGDYVFDGLDSGSYMIYVKDAAGCIAPHSFTKVELQSSTRLSSTLSNVPPCPGEMNGEICITPNGGFPKFVYTVTFEDEEQTVVEGPGPGCQGAFHVPNVGMGNYCIEMVDSVRCQASGLYAVAEEGVNVAFETTPACEGQNIGSIDVSISGGTPAYTIIWDTDAETEDLEDLLPGTYTISVTDTRGCLTVQPIQVESYTIDLTAAVNPTCNEQNIGAINVTTNGGILPYTFSWSNEADTEDITGLDEGTYTLNVLDSNGCVAEITEGVTKYEMTVAVDEQGTCEGTISGSLTANANGGIEPYSYTWSNNNVNMTNSPLPAGDYTVAVFDANGCEVNADGTVESFPSPSVDIEGGTIFPRGESTDLNAVVTGGTAPYTYEWSPSNILSTSNTQSTSAFPGEAVNVQVIVTDANGCTAAALVNIQVFIPPILPTGFTPNNDGNNDVFEPIFRGFQLNVTLFQVFDRWGKKVYEANDETGWDGTFNNTDQPIGTYVYFLEYEDPLGNRETLKGQVTLLR